MTKSLYRIAERAQATLRALYAPATATTWADHAPRLWLDAWAALWAWDAAGQPVTRITDEAEHAILAHPLPADLPLATAPTRRGAAIGCIMPERTLWAVVARIDARQGIPVYGAQSFGHTQPLLVWLRNEEGDGISAGYYSLHDQPTLGSLHLLPGTSLRADGTTRPLGAAEVAEDDYRVLLALHYLYRHDPS